MREIKFRGKRVVNGEWVYGLPVNYCDKTYVLVLTDFEEERVYEAYPHEEMWPYEVVPETVGQYTGLKDRDGIEIYEGDVMHNRSIIPQWDKDLINEIQVVVLIKKGMTQVDGWNANGYMGEEINRVHYMCLLLNPEIFEVIGNIHDNPELMEVTND